MVSGAVTHRTNDVSWCLTVPSQIPNYWVRSCVTCGEVCVRGVPKEGERKYKAKGMCDLCYYRDRTPPQPKELRVCQGEGCEALMVPRNNDTLGGKFKVHHGHGLCSRCYKREKRRINASDDTHAGAGD